MIEPLLVYVKGIHSNQDKLFIKKLQELCDEYDFEIDEIY